MAASLLIREHSPSPQPRSNVNTHAHTHTCTRGAPPPSSQVAANTKGIALVGELIREHSLPTVVAYMGFIQANAEGAVREMLREFSLRQVCVCCVRAAAHVCNALQVQAHVAMLRLSTRSYARGYIWPLGTITTTLLNHDM